MIFKWWWNFQVDNNTLWNQVITSIHGKNSGIGLNSPNSQPHQRSWKYINLLSDTLLNTNINLHSTFLQRIGQAHSFSSWNEHWIGDLMIKDTFPRLFNIETSKNYNMAKTCNTIHGPTHGLVFVSTH